MSKLLAVLVLMGSMTAFANIDNYGSGRLVDQSQYTCQQLRTLLTQERTLWFRSRILPFVQFNIAADRNAPLRCGGGYSSGELECRYYRGQVTAMDGKCQLGVACSCQNTRRGGDRDRGGNNGGEHGGNPGRPGRGGEHGQPGDGPGHGGGNNGGNHGGNPGGPGRGGEHGQPSVN